MNTNRFMPGQIGQPANSQRKEILVPVDFTTGSVTAIQHAVTLAAECNGHITLLNVIEEPLSFRHLDTVRAKSKRRHECERRLARLMEREIAGKIQADALVCEGNVDEQINRAASDQHADLIVLAPHPHRGMGHFFTHTVQRVLRSAPCQVIVLEESSAKPEQSNP